MYSNNKRTFRKITHNNIEFTIGGFPSDILKPDKTFDGSIIQIVALWFNEDEPYSFTINLN